MHEWSLFWKSVTKSICIDKNTCRDEKNVTNIKLIELIQLFKEFRTVYFF